MDTRLLAKVQPIEEYAADCGWETERVLTTVDGMEAVQIVGTTCYRHPDVPAGVDFGFTMAFALNPQTNRAITLRLDGKQNAGLVVTVDDDTGRYWYGPLSHYKRALEDPQGWTGVFAPAPAEADGELTKGARA